MVLRKHPQSIKICLALVVSLFSTGILPTSYAYAAKPTTPPGQAAKTTSASQQNTSSYRQAQPSRSQSAAPQSTNYSSYAPSQQATATYSAPAPASSSNQTTTAVGHAKASKSTSPKAATKTKAVTPGNNGTVKITEVGDPNTSPPNNDPHVACTFDVEFYKFDANAISSIGFSPDVGPQGTPDTARIAKGSPTVSLDKDGVTGGTRFDGEETYRLDMTGTPHPKQGYHLKLTTNTTWSNGSTKKSKVFWLQPCTTTTTTNPPTTPSGGGGHGGGNPTPPPSSQPKVLASSIETPHSVTPKTLGAATMSLPASIPATGGISEGNPFLILIASLVAYGTVYFLQGRRKLAPTE